MARRGQPKIHIDDLHPKNDGYVHAYHASWQESRVIAELTLDIVEREHWKHGQYRKHAYELVSSIRTVSGRPLRAIQEETALLLLRELRAQMLVAMTDAGWQEVASTREGQPIYQPLAPQESSAVQDDELLPHSDQIAPQELQQMIVRKTRLVTFTCQWCQQEVIEQRFPSHTPLYCSKPECKLEANRVKTRERVAKHRRLHPDARKKKIM